jgi:hypothetical protein
VAYDEAVAARIRRFLGVAPGLAEKKMFGGLAMLLDGNMACGVRGDELIVRTDPSRQSAYLDEPGAHVFDMSGRPMAGWLLVGPVGFAADDDLARWLTRGVDYARGLPPK